MELYHHFPLHAFVKRTRTTFIVMVVGKGKGKCEGKVHPIIGHEGPEIENRSGQREREKKKDLSQCHKSKQTGIRNEHESDQG